MKNSHIVRDDRHKAVTTFAASLQPKDHLEWFRRARYTTHKLLAAVPFNGFAILRPAVSEQKGWLMDNNSLEMWMNAYGEAWESRDPEKAAALFAEDAAYFETSFSPPARGRDGVRQYWASAVAGQRGVKFSYELLTVTGQQGIARWSAEFTRVSTGNQTKLDGVFLLTFDDNNLCRELREWWFATTVQ